MRLKAYYDGSGNSSDPASEYLTLAGYIGTHQAWVSFETAWKRVVDRWPCDYVHMVEARHLDGEFAFNKGWTRAKVDALISELTNECFAEIGWYKNRNDFCGAACTLNLLDYRQACIDLPGLEPVKSAEALCVDGVVTVALQMLPASDTSVTGKSGDLELIFDRNEQFLHKINRVWLRQKKQGVFRHITSITPGVMECTPGLQAADMLAWHTNYAHSKRDAFTKLVAQTMCPSHCYELDYDAIVKLCAPILNRQHSWDG